MVAVTVAAGQSVQQWNAAFNVQRVVGRKPEHRLVQDWKWHRILPQ